MTVGSLFSGVGGLDLGLERSGMTIAWQVEVDDFCKRVLARHWPHVPRYGDVRELTGYELEPVDLIAAGIPCQPVSLAGKKLGAADPRWLWPELVRIVRVVRPRYVLLENVPGLLVRWMGRVLGDLAELGYDAEWTVLRASDFGAPHERARVFVVAYSSSFRCSAGAATTCVFADSVPEAPRRAPWRDTCRIERGASGRVFCVPDPGVCGVAYGVPHRVDRLRALGNAVVPQVAEWIGRRIIAFELRAHGEAERDPSEARMGRGTDDAP